MSGERELRERITMHGKSLFDRGFTCGSSGNISVRLPDGILVTPTNSCLGRIDPDRISKVSWSGELIAGEHPSKEAFLHQSVYAVRDTEQAIVHLHSTHSVAVSCLNGMNETDVLPAITAYYVMRVGKLPLVPYFAPGDEELAKAVEQAAKHARAVLLANHGPVVSGVDLDAAVYAMEELEETAKLFLMLQDKPTRYLTEQQREQLVDRFPS